MVSCPSTMSTKYDTLKKLFDLLGDRGWGVIRQAIQAEIDEQKSRLRELQEMHQTLRSQSGRPDVTLMIEKISKVLYLNKNVPMGASEITEQYNALNESSISQSTIGNCLSKNKGIIFLQHGERRWTKWSLVKSE